MTKIGDEDIVVIEDSISAIRNVNIRRSRSRTSAKELETVSDSSTLPRRSTRRLNNSESSVYNKW